MVIKGKEFKYVIEGQDFHCAMDVTMHFLGGKWKTVVLWYLQNEAKRFSELNALIPQITEKMLSLQLKALVKDGLVERKVFPTVPPQVEYSLSEDGKSAIPLLKELAKWGKGKAALSGEMVEK